MRVLVIGGARFVGKQLAHRLVLRGDRVTLLNRGSQDDGLGAAVERVVADRGTDAFDHALAGRTFDAVVDFAAFHAADAERASRVLSGRVGHYLFVGTGQVYLVRQGCPTPSREEDYDGPLMAPPEDARDHAEWAYGVGKRGAEDVLAEAFERTGFPATRMRIPVLHGPGDPHRRIERLVARALDGGPLLVPRPDALVRHVHGPSLARWMVERLGDTRWIGEAVNVAPESACTVREMVSLIADGCGSRAARLEVEPELLASVGWRAEDVCPFGGRWSSVLDPSRAVRSLGFAHPTVDAWLPGVLDAVLAHHDPVPPADVVRHRASELALARRLGA